MNKTNPRNVACRVGLLVVLGIALCQAAEPSAPVLLPLPTEDRPLAERFAEPPASTRILRILHAQRDNPAEQDQQLGVMLFRSANPNVPKRLGGTVPTALSMTCEPLPKTPKPAVGQGQFVQSELTGDDTSGWRAAATLTKGQVDTFLFLNFAYTEPLDLTACEGLAIDASVPQGQRSGTELLVFLNTSSGDRFLGSTGRYLNSPGSSRAYAMFSQFRPFGQTVGELDLSKVASISVGWGGYLGTEGEQIIFTVRPAQRFVCNVDSYIGR